MNPSSILVRAGLLVSALSLAACSSSVALRADAEQPAAPATPTRLFLDVHRVGAGKVTREGVAEAHAQDLAAEAAHGVDYERYWLDEDSGTIFCLVRAPSAAAAATVHREAHGLLADEIHEVTPGILPAAPSGSMSLFMDTHQVAPGTSAAQVAEAHEKDLAAQGAHGTRFLEYWVDETTGRVHCLAEAPSADALVATHRDAHGLLPSSVVKVAAGR